MARQGATATGWLLALVLLLGAVVRVAYLVEITAEPDFAHPGRDALYHDYWARALAFGDWTPPAGKADPEIRTSPYLRPPGYPYFLAAVYRLTGGSYLAARIVQMALGLLSVALAFLLGRRLFGAAVGVVAAAFLAFYWIFPYYEGELHEPVVTVALSLGLLLALEGLGRRPSWWGAAACGLLLGLLALVRPNALLLAPAALLWLGWRGRRDKALRRLAAPALGLLLGAAAAVAPVTVRNVVRGGDLVLISANAGINLYLAHHDGATGVSAVIPGLRQTAGLSGWTCFDYPAIVRGVERQLGRPPGSLSYSEASAYFARRALGWIGAHPGKALAAAAARLSLFFGPDEVSNDEVVAYDRRGSALLRLLPGSFPLLLTLALVGGGLWLAGRRGAPTGEGGAATGVALLLVFLVTYTLSVLPTIVAARYRVPLLPVLSLFAALALVEGVGLLRRRELAAAAAVAGAGVAVFLVVRHDWVGYEPDAGAWHFDRAVAFEHAGDPTAAIAEYEAALALDPADADAHSNLGNLLAARGELGAAVAHYERALAEEPDHAESHNNLGVALTRLGREAEAVPHYERALAIRPGYAEAANNLGLALLRLGRVEEALAPLTRAAELAPRYENAHRNLATARLAAGDLAGAVEELETVARLAPEDAAAAGRLGTLRAQLGDVEGAIEELERAVELAPETATLRNDLANALALAGRLDEAIAAWRQALAIDPGSVAARVNLARAYAATGRFPEAVREAEEAASRARRAGDGALFEELERRLALYRSGRVR